MLEKHLTQLCFNLICEITCFSRPGLVKEDKNTWSQSEITPTLHSGSCCFVNLKISHDSDSHLHKTKQHDIKPIFFSPQARHCLQPALS